MLTYEELASRYRNLCLSLGMDEESEHLPPESRLAEVVGVLTTDWMHENVLKYK